MNSLEVLGVRIDDFDKRQLFQKLDVFLRSDRCNQIVTVNSEFIVESLKNRNFKNILSESDLNAADSVGVLWAARYLAIPFSKNFLVANSFVQLIATALEIVFCPSRSRAVLKNKNSGTDLIWQLCEYAEKSGLKIFLLGGYGDTPQKSADVLKKRFPKLRVAGAYAGSPGEEGIAEKINSTGADILMVAFGPVRQEEWISANLRKLTPKTAIGLGGTFDYLAGKKPIAPRFLRYTGLEWLWRLITQPYRIIRVFKAVFVFMFNVWLEKMRRTSYNR